MINDADGSSKIILSEPTGSTAEVCAFAFILSVFSWEFNYVLYDSTVLCICLMEKEHVHAFSGFLRSKNVVSLI